MTGPAAWTAVDNVNGMSMSVSGGEILIFRKLTATAVVVTVKSNVDRFGRTKDVTQSVDNTQYFIYGPVEMEGWTQADGKLWIDAAGAGVEVMAIRKL